MKKDYLPHFSLLFFLLLTTTVFSQKDYQVKGKILDDQKKPLESATVYLEAVNDSTMVDYTLSDTKGNFVIDGATSVDKINLFISFTGFRGYKKELSLAKNRNIDIGTISLKMLTNDLDEVILTGQRAPVTIKKDTLEFNAASFKTKPDAHLEDVLKKLPGVEVDNDGKITVNGKDVSRILVNGKEFFGDDPKIATKNLPKEIINKIQVVDTKTKSQEFTGKEGDSENKTINITIDKDKNKGFFARLTAGGGTKDRYAMSGIGNYFKDKMRVSVLASSNNINSSGFTFDEVFDAMGRSAYSIAGGSNSGGITKAENAGMDFTNEWSKKAELSGNYFFNRADTRSETKIQRENILPDRTYFNNSNSSSERQNDNHRMRVGFEIEPDTLTRISFRPNVNVNNGSSDSNSFTESFEEDNTPINNATTKRHNEAFNLNFSNRLDVTRKFGANGGFVRVGFNNKNNTNENDNFYYSSREIFDDAGELKDTKVQDQYIDQDQKEDEYEVQADARLPIISDKLFVDVGYSYRKNNQSKERLVYEQNATTNAYDLLNNDLSNNFNAEIFDQRPSTGLVYRSDDLRASLSGGLENVRLKNEDVFTGESFDNTYNNLFLDAHFRYKINKTQSIYFRYNSSRNTPSINQLQPVTNTTNPLNIVTGNPDLKPSLRHNAYMNFNNYDFKTHTGLYVYLGGNYIADQVLSKTITDEDLLRTTTYTNIDGAASAFAGASFSKKYDLENSQSLRVKGGVRGNFDRNLGFSNGQKFHANRFTITPQLGFEYDIDELVTLEPNYNMNIVNARYSLNSDRDENYINHNVGFQVTSYWPENFIFGSDLNYRYIGNAAPGFKNSYYLWNLSLGYKILGDDGIFKVKVFDVLDQNVSTRRNTGDDFIQDTQQLVLPQYMMFSFTYKLSKFAGGKNKGRGHGRRRH